MKLFQCTFTNACFRHAFRVKMKNRSCNIWRKEYIYISEKDMNEMIPLKCKSFVFHRCCTVHTAHVTGFSSYKYVMKSLRIPWAHTYCDSCMGRNSSSYVCGMCGWEYHDIYIRLCPFDVAVNHWWWSKWQIQLVLTSPHTTFVFILTKKQVYPLPSTSIIPFCFNYIVPFVIYRYRMRNILNAQIVKEKKTSHIAQMPFFHANCHRKTTSSTILNLRINQKCFINQVIMNYFLSSSYAKLYCVCTVHHGFMKIYFTLASLLLHITLRRIHITFAKSTAARFCNEEERVECVT